MAQKNIAPSLICMDLCNLEQEIREMESLGCGMIHVDIIDGIFSPDMPLGIETVRRLRKKTDMIFDVHLMAVNNAPYVDMLLACGVDRLCFHPEFEARPSILLRKIKAAGVKVGLAISPETTVESLKYLLPLCDFVLLMRIDAGYAHLAGQFVYPQTEEKIGLIQKYGEQYGFALELELDGRMGFEETAVFSKLGVSTFVSGTKGIFCPDGSRKENWDRLQKILKE